MMVHFKLIPCFLVTSIILFVFGLVEKNYAQDKKPNILLIMTDDQGYGDIGIHGNCILKTPNMDALAKQSTEMTHFYVNPNCTPTRASLLTGRWNFRTGIMSVQSTEAMMNSEETTMAEVLSKAGYKTGIFGKWHLGDNYPMRSTDNGFKESLVHKGGGIGQASDPPGNSYFDPILQHNSKPKKYEGYSDDIFADATLQFIEENANSSNPFFAYYATNLPHLPLQVPDKRADPYRELGNVPERVAKLYGMISNVDANIGRLMDKLDELGIEDNTIVIFLSDNGPRNRRTKNDVEQSRYVAGLRGTKTSVYENGIRVPFLIRWPGKIPAGRKQDDFAAHIDIFPTLLDAANIDYTGKGELDGVSLLPLLKEEEDSLPDREFYFQWHNGHRPYQYLHFTVLSSDGYKLIQSLDNPHGVMRPPTYSELDNMLNSLELYNIKKDSSELNNIAEQKPKKVEELLGKYDDWFQDVIQDGHFDSPQHIYIGTKHQPHIILSQFDWTSPIMKRNELGYWKVHSKAGNYRIKLRFDKAKKPDKIKLRYKNIKAENKIQTGDTVSVFNNIFLQEGKGNFEAYIENDRLHKGVRYVDIIKLDG